MKKIRHTQEQIAFALKQAETHTSVAEVIRRRRMSDHDRCTLNDPLLRFAQLREVEFFTKTEQPDLHAARGDRDVRMAIVQALGHLWTTGPRLSGPSMAAIENMRRASCDLLAGALARAI